MGVGLGEAALVKGRRKGMDGQGQGAHPKAAGWVDEVLVAKEVPHLSVALFLLDNPLYIFLVLAFG
jgi:hypothetical protein